MKHLKYLALLLLALPVSAAYYYDVNHTTVVYGFSNQAGCNLPSGNFSATPISTTYGPFSHTLGTRVGAFQLNSGRWAHVYTNASTYSDNFSVAATIGMNLTIDTGVCGTNPCNGRYDFIYGNASPGTITNIVAYLNIQGGQGQSCSNPPIEPIIIYTSPGVTNAAGSGLSLTSTVVGASSYQWTHNGTNIAGATNPIITLSGSYTNIGSYELIASNGSGSRTSSVSTVYINTNTPTIKTYALLVNSNKVLTGISNIVVPSTNGDITISNGNITMAIQYIDLPVSSFTLAGGANAPQLATVNDGLGIQSMAWDNTDLAYANAQYSHNVAETNSVNVQLVVHPHIHVMPLSNLGAGATNAQFRLTWGYYPVGTNAVLKGTNTVQWGATGFLTNAGYHSIVAFTPITNGTLGISADFRFKLERIAATSNEISGRLAVEFFDIHIPVGNKTLLGSRQEVVQ